MAENWGGDIPDGEVTSFPMAVKCAEDKTVVFSWVLWPDRTTRETGMNVAMADKRYADLSPDKMPFDSKRMIVGGCETIVND